MWSHFPGPGLETRLPPQGPQRTKIFELCQLQLPFLLNKAPQRGFRHHFSVF